MTSTTTQISGSIRPPAPQQPLPTPPTPKAGLVSQQHASWPRLLAGVAVWLSLLIVTALWVKGGGLAPAAGLGDAANRLGRLTGLLASDLLLIQVLLIARVPLVERAFGQDQLVRMHRSVGTGSFVLMVTHLILIVIGYAEAAPARLWSTFLDMTLSMPGMLLALAGFACLVMVVVTSLTRLRPRLRYESWHLLHLYAYLGCFLALPHQLWTGTDFLSSPVATAYWWTLWAAAALSVIAFRVVLPVLRNRRHALVVEQVTPAGGNVTTVAVTGRELGRLPALPGQFFVWRFLDGPGWTRGHPYSLSAAPDGQRLEISVAALGDGSARVAQLRPGTKVLIEGPYGRMHTGVATREQVVCIAAGIGIGPMKALLDGLDRPAGAITVIYRTRDRHDAPLLATLTQLASDRGARLILLDGPRQIGRTSWLPRGWEHVSDPAALRYLVPEVSNSDVFVCGNPVWMASVEAALADAAVPADQIHLERFDF